MNQIQRQGIDHIMPIFLQFAKFDSIPKQNQGERKCIHLIMAVPRWVQEPVKVYYANSVGTLVNKTYVQHYPTVRLVTETGSEINQACCTKHNGWWLCECYAKIDINTTKKGWARLVQKELVNKVVRIQDMACAIGYHNFSINGNICPASEAGFCVPVTSTIQIGAHAF